MHVCGRTLQAHLQDRPTLYKIAAAAGCSNTELAKRTRIEFGHSLGEEKARMQLSLAVDMLRNTSKTVFIPYTDLQRNYRRHPTGF